MQLNQCETAPLDMGLFVYLAEFTCFHHFLHVVIHLWSTCKALRHIRSIVFEWPEDNHESDENIESTQRTSLAAFSSGTVRTGPVRRTLESPFEWVPEQLSRFLTDPTIAMLLEHPGQ